MIDEVRKNRLRVGASRTAGPYLMLPLAQLDRVCEVLDRHSIRYWVDSDAISLDGKPPMIVINFGRKGDVAQIQAVLDEAV